jgi:hypothetical protein
MDRSGWRTPPKPELPKKSLWKGAPSHIYSFYCPLCAVNRRVPYRSRPGGVRQISQIAITAAFFTLVTWELFSWKGIVSFVPFWAVFEFMYRSRMRASLKCHSCGFDPFLCLTDMGQAKAEIDRHWRKKFAEKGIPYPGSVPETLPPMDAPQAAKSPTNA